MNGTKETKSEIRARIHELNQLLTSNEYMFDSNPSKLHKSIQRRVKVLKKELERAQEDLSASITESHKAICKVKKMGEKDAYGNDPAMYYTLGICGESGEMANAIVKARRNGSDQKKVLAAVCSELPDVIIYSYVLAYVLDIDLSKLVNEKVAIVIKRAIDGYYGGPLKRGSRKKKNA
jgi:NTP pyrophosphatase (non-canonical NTP hydrolase)